ncbi:MAG: hypothetical protein FWD69_14515 [Polyangiaceae bacterium]|nr:hypothetical protein [Polyangiaceae bacterium]
MLVRGIVLFALLAAGCTGFDLPTEEQQDAGDAATGYQQDAGDAATGYVVSTVAGTGVSGAADGTAATFSSPTGVAVLPDGSLYVADYGNHKIRKVAVDGSVITYAGTGKPGLNNGSCAAAIFNHPASIAVDAAGKVYVADVGNAEVRKITTDCQVSTLAGASTGTAFDGLDGLTVDASGTVYLVNNGNGTIWKVAPGGDFTLVAGIAGTAGHADGAASIATFNQPEGIAVDTAGTLYVAEIGNKDVRTIAGGTVSTLPGAFNSPMDLAVDTNGNVFVADSANNMVRKISPDGEVTTLAGSGAQGAMDGPATQATFNNPQGVAVDSNGIVYVADTYNHKIRKIAPAQ